MTKLSFGDKHHNLEISEKQVRQIANNSEVMVPVPRIHITVHNDDGSWLVDPESTFPLIVDNANELAIQKLRRLLDIFREDGLDDITAQIARLVKGYKLRIRQIDDYVNTYRPHYLKNLEQDSDPWRAFFALDMYPDCGPAIFKRPLPSAVVAEIIWKTDIAGMREAEYQNRRRDCGLFRFERICADDRCPFCRRAASQIYKSGEAPKCPLHIACKCSIIGSTRPETR
jgi:hypothetical protein